MDYLNEDLFNNINQTISLGRFAVTSSEEDRKIRVYNGGKEVYSCDYNDIEGRTLYEIDYGDIEKDYGKIYSFMIGGDIFSVLQNNNKMIIYKNHNLIYHKDEDIEIFNIVDANLIYHKDEDIEIFNIVDAKFKIKVDNKTIYGRKYLDKDEIGIWDRSLSIEEVEKIKKVRWRLRE